MTALATALATSQVSAIEVTNATGVTRTLHAPQTQIIPLQGQAPEPTQEQSTAQIRTQAPSSSARQSASQAVQTTSSSARTSTYQGGNATFSVSDYIKEVNALTWAPDMKVNTAMTVKMQVLLDWNHVSAGTIDGGWGEASRQALINFQRMKGLATTGKMDTTTWSALTQNIPSTEPVFTRYTITQSDVKTPFAKLPSSVAERAKVDGLYFESIEEMLAERFHMSIAYLRKLNPNATYQAGEVLNVINVGKSLSQPINHIRVHRAENTLYAYNNTAIIAAYPVKVGSNSVTIPVGTYTIVNKVSNPWYKATVSRDNKPQGHMLPPGPNNPLGVMWLGFDKASYGIHGAPSPEGILLNSNYGAIRMISWDILELAQNIKDGVTVEVL